MLVCKKQKNILYAVRFPIARGFAVVFFFDNYFFCFEACNLLISFTATITAIREIGRVLSRTQSTVYEYFIKMRQRYTAIYV